MKCFIKVVQVYRVERETIIEVEAASPHDAAEMIGIGEVGLPAFDDPVWTESRTLENETCFPT